MTPRKQTWYLNSQRVSSLMTSRISSRVFAWSIFTAISCRTTRRFFTPELSVRRPCSADFSFADCSSPSWMLYLFSANKSPLGSGSVLHDFADQKRFFPVLTKFFHDLFGGVFCRDNHQPDAEIERPAHVLFGDIAGRLDELKEEGPVPALPRDLQRQPTRNDARRISRNSSAGDVSKSVHLRDRDKALDHRQVRAMDGKERFTERHL